MSASKKILVKTWKLKFKPRKKLVPAALTSRRKEIELYIKFYLQGFSNAITKRDPDLKWTYSFMLEWKTVGTHENLVCEVFMSHVPKKGKTGGEGGPSVVPSPPVALPQM